MVIVCDEALVKYGVVMLIGVLATDIDTLLAVVLLPFDTSWHEMVMVSLNPL
jgi:hypothetical protein